MSAPASLIQFWQFLWKKSLIIWTSLSGSSKMSILYALEWGHWSFHAQLNTCFYHTSLLPPLSHLPFLNSEAHRAPWVRPAPFVCSHPCTSSRRCCFSLVHQLPVLHPFFNFQNFSKSRLLLDSSYVLFHTCKDGLKKYCFRKIKLSYWTRNFV